MAKEKTANQGTENSSDTAKENAAEGSRPAAEGETAEQQGQQAAEGQEGAAEAGAEQATEGDAEGKGEKGEKGKKDKEAAEKAERAEADAEEADQEAAEQEAEQAAAESTQEERASDSKQDSKQQTNDSTLSSRSSGSGAKQAATLSENRAAKQQESKSQSSSSEGFGENHSSQNRSEQAAASANENAAFNRGGSSEDQNASTEVFVQPNRAPGAGNVELEPATEDAVRVISQQELLANSEDADGDQLTVSAVAVANPAHGTVQKGNGTNWEFTPAENFNGTDIELRFTVSDGQAQKSATATLSITAVDDAPAGSIDAIEVDEDGRASGELGPRVDVDGESLVYSEGNAVPEHGVVFVDEDGTYSYIPDENFNGTDTFSYVVSDGKTSVEQTVTVTINAIDDTPEQSQAAVEISVVEDTPASGSVGDSVDVDGQALTYQLSGQPAHGSIELNADGTYTYVPDADYNGPDEFTYVVTDGTTPVEQTVSILISAVDDAPGAAAKTTEVLVEEDSIAEGTLGEAKDVDGQPLAYAVGNTVPANGQLTVNADGSYSYTPNPDFNGEDTFSYVVTDGTNEIEQIVTVSVTGVADAAVVGGESTGSVEDAPNQTANGALTITDADAGEASFTADTVQGVYGSLTINADGVWTYALDNAKSQPLGAGDNATDIVMVTTAGGDQQAITISIAGSNDAAVITGNSTASISEGVDRTTTGRLSVSDPDAGEAAFVAETRTGTQGSLTIDAQGNWTYTLDNTKAQSLGAGDTATDILVVTTEGGDTREISITVNGSDDAATITGTQTGSISEDAADQTVSGSLTVSDPDAGESAFIAETLGGTYGSLAIDAAGVWTYTLANDSAAVQSLGAGATATDILPVTTAGGDTFEISVTVNGSDDAAIIGGTTSGQATEDTSPSVSGTLTVSDADADESAFAAATVAGNYGSLVIDAEGAWTYATDDRAQTLAGGATATENLIVTTAGGDQQQITITLSGTDDAAVITGTQTGEAREDNTQIATGKLSVTDADAGEASFTAESLTGTYGSLAMQADGNWTYTLANDSAAVQSLGAGATATDKLTVTTAGGDTREISITVNGTDDAAEIAGTTTGGVQEDTTQTATGQLTITDADEGESAFTAETLPGTYGSLQMLADGNWTYTLDDAKVQSLGEGDSATDLVTVTSAGGDTQQITITIVGTDDVAVISGADAAAVTEDSVQTVSGSFTATDPDAGESGFIAETKAGTQGSITIDAEGNWTYTLDNAKAQSLGAGDTATDNLSVTTLGGDTQQITITVNGSDDAATITGTQTGSVTEETTQAATGKLSVTDVDSGEASFTAGPVQGNYGSLAMQADGNWTYTLANDSLAVQELGGSDTATDILTVSTVGGDTFQISVTVNGTDDAAVIGGTTSGAATEDTNPSASGTLTISDADADESAFAAATVAGSYGSLVIDAEGAWTYATDDRAQTLAGGATATENLIVTTAGGDEQQITITLTGTDDAAVITGTQTGNATEDTKQTATGTLSVTDADAGEASFVAGPSQGTYGSLVMQADGNWTYTLANDSAAVQSLGAGTTATDTLAVTTAGGDAREITITVNGSDDEAVIGGTTSGAAIEDTNPSASGTLTITDADADESAFVAETVSGSYGSVVIDAAGAWTYMTDDRAQALAGDATATENLIVTTAGGDEQQITITLTGTDDAAVITGTQTGNATEDTKQTATGTLSVTDADAGEASFVAGPSQGTYGSLVMQADGNWTYTLANDSGAVQSLGAGSTATDTLTVTTAGGDAREITITVNGSDDAATITGTQTGSVTEETTQAATGKLSVTDVDSGEASFTAGPVQGNYGSLAMQADGNWTYTLANDSLAVQELGGSDTATDILTVSTVGGDTFQISVTVNGTDDAAVIGGTTSGAATEDTNPSASGTLTITDADADESAFVAETVSGSYGSVVIDEAGAWTYRTDDRAQALAGDATATENLIVTTAGGDEQQITITLSGTDDAAVITGTQAGSVTEETTQTATGKLTVTDADGGEASFTAESLTGTYGSLAMQADGNWTYTLANDSVAVQELGADDTATDILTVTTAGGDASEITITVNGTNDGAQIGGTVAGDVQEDTTQTATGVLSITDSDAGEATFTAETLPGAYGSLQMLADGNWTYTLDDAKVQSLGEGDSATDLVTVTSAGGDTQQITITIAGTDDVAVISGADAAAVTEDSVQTVSGSFTATDPDAGESGFIAETKAGTQGSITIDAEGNWTYTLDNAKAQSLGAGDTATDNLSVTTLGGDTQQITITVNGSDDAATITGTQTGSVTEETTQAATGKLSVTDVDSGEASFTAGPVQGNYGSLAMQADGNWTYTLANDSLAVQELGGSDTATDILTVSTVGGDTFQISVTVNGTDDAAVIGGTTSGAATEDTNPSASGTLTISDADADESAFAAATVAGSYGSLVIDAEGAWTYATDDRAQTLAGGATATENLIVTTAGGDEQQITITLTGTDDAAVITGTQTGNATEDTKQTATGILSVTDADAGEASFVAGPSQGDYGSLVIQADGNWTYTLANDSAAVQSLGAGTTATDTLAVTTAGGDAREITITVNGSDDEAVIGGTTSGAAIEDTNPSASGTLTITDADADESAFVAETVSGSYGSVVIDAAGAWTYMTDDRAQALAGDATATENLIVTTAGGDEQQITITLTGTDDAAVITGTQTGNATEDTKQTATGTLSVTDADAGEASFVAGPSQGTYGSLVMQADGNWTYTLANDSGAVQSLGAGSTATDTLTVTTAGGDAREITITVNGSDDAATITGTQTGSVTEETTQAATGKLSVTDVDSGEASFTAGPVQGNYGSLAMQADGNWTYTLANDSLAVQELGGSDTATDILTVSTVGGDTFQISVTVNGTDDAAVIGGTTSGAATEDTNPSASGTLTITDADADESAFVAETVSGSYGSVVIDEAGAWTYRTDDRAQALAGDATATENLIVTTAGGDEQQITITLTGTDDAAVITGTQTGNATEDTKQTATGILSVTDADAGEASFVAGPSQGDYGSLVIQADGNWTYTLANDSAAVQSLGAGATATDVLTVTTAGGDTREITITVNGSDDAPIITVDALAGDSDAANLEETDNTLTASSTLSVEDIDASDVVNVSVESVVVTGNDGGLSPVGMMSIDAGEVIGSSSTTGQLTWTFSSGMEAFDHLAAGETLSLKYNVVAMDSHGASDNHPVIIQITGTNDAPIVTSSQTEPVVLVVDSAPAQSAPEGEFLVSSETSGEGNAITALNDGGFVVTWTQPSAGGSTTEVYSQVFEDSGAARTDKLFVADIGSGNGEPAVSNLSDGGFVVAWSTADGFNEGVVQAQTFAADGSASSAVPIDVSQIGGYTSSVSAYDGGFVTVWEGYLTAGTDTDTGIIGQLVGLDGIRVGSEFQINTSTANLQQTPAVTQLADGGFVVTWETWENFDPSTQNPDDITGFKISGQRFDAAGQAVDGEFTVAEVAQGTGENTRPDVAALDNGGFVIIWQSDQGDVDTGVRGQVYDAAGTATAFQVNTNTVGFQGYPGVDASPNGGFIVTWETEDATTGDAYGIVAQEFDVSGQPLAGSSEILINQQIPGEQWDPEIAVLNDGSFAVAWQSQSADPTNDPSEKLVARVIGGAPQDYSVEQHPPVTVDGTLTISDVDSTQLASATIAIGGYASDQDLLFVELPDPSPFQASWNDLGGTLELTVSSPGGTASLAEFQDMLRLVQYQNFGDEPSTADRSISFSVTDDAGGSSDVASVTIDLLARPDAGYVDLGSTDENTERTIAESELLASARDLDGDTLTVTSATLSDTAAGELLDNGNGTWTFNPTAEFSGNDIGISFSVSDGTYTDAGEAVIDVFSVNDAPEIVSERTLGTAYVLPSSAEHQATLGEIIQVNENWTEGSESNYETMMIALAGGGFVVTWNTQDPASGGRAEVAAQVFNSGFEKVGGELRINTDVVETQSNIALVAMADGGFVSIWSTYVPDANGTLRTYYLGQRFDEGGNTVGNEFDLPGLIGNHKPVSNLTNGTGANEFELINGDGYLKKYSFDSTGTVTESSPGLRPGTFNFMRLSNGDYLKLQVQSERDTQSTTSNDYRYYVEGQVFSDDGTLQSTYTLADVLRSNSPLEAVALDSGGFLLLAMTGEDYVNREFTGQIFSADGVASGPKFSVDSTGFNYYSGLQVSVSTNNDFLVHWNSSSAQRFDGSGEKVGDVFDTGRVPPHAGGLYSPPFALVGGDVASLVRTDQGEIGVRQVVAEFGYSGDPVGVDRTIQVSDVDNDFLQSAAVQITNAFSDQDVLAFTTPTGSNITGTYDAAAGTLNLMGEATVAQYQEALRSVTYDNTSADPAREDREISFTVNDGQLDSTPMVSTMQIVDDTPPRALTSTLEVVEDVKFHGHLEGSDDEAGTLTFSLVGLPENGVVSIQENGSFTYESSDNFHGVDEFIYSVSDGSNETKQSVTVTVSGVNDAADISSDEIIQVNENWTEGSESNYETMMIALAGGGFVVTWNTQDPASGGRAEVAAQVFNSGFEKVGGELRINTDVVETQSNIALVAMADGGFVSIWSTYVPDANGTLRTYYLGQRFDEGGNTVGNEFDLPGLIGNHKPVSNLTNGTGANEFELINGDGYLKKYSFDSTGTVTESSPGLRPGTFNFMRLSNGDYLKLQVQSERDTQSTTSNDYRYYVEGQVFSDDGTLQSTYTLADVLRSNSPLEAVALDSGGFLLLAMTGEDYVNREFTGQIFSADGVASGPKFSVDSTGFNYYSGLQVSVSTNNDFLVHWNSSSAQRFDGSGEKVGDVFDTGRVPPHAGGLYSPPFALVGGDVASLVRTDQGEIGVRQVVAEFGYSGDPVGVDRTIQVSDVDNDFLQSAAVQITNAFSDQDVLAFTTPTGSNITGTYDAAAGTLNLMGEATVAQYQEALRSVTYDNTSADPAREDREISFTVNDGQLDSTPMVSTMQIVDDTPPRALTSTLEVVEDVKFHGHLEGSDDEAGTLTFSLVGLPENGVVSIQENGSFTYESSDNFHGVDEFIYSVSDGSNETKQSVTVTVSGVNDAADISSDEIIQVNENWTEGSESNYETMMIALAGGGFVVTWNTQDPASGGRAEVAAQVFNSGFEKVGGELRINTDVVETQSNIALVAMADGGFVSIWSTYVPDANGTLRTYYLGQRFDEGGNTVGNEFDLPGLIGNHKPVSNLTNGTGANEFELINGDGYLKKYSFDSTGTVTESSPGLRPGTFNFMRLSNGDYLKLQVQSERDTQSTTSNDYRYYVEGQVFSDDGTLQSTYTLADVLRSNSPLEAVALDSGGFLLLAMTGEDYVNREFTGQIFSADGVASGPKFSVDSTGFNYYSGLQVSVSTNNDFLVHWNSSSAQRFDGSGEKVGDVFDTGRVPPHAGGLYSPPFALVGGDVASLVRTDQGEIGVRQVVAEFGYSGDPVGVDRTIQVSDVDNDFLQSAAVQITNAFSDQDVLAFTTPTGSNITGTYDAAAGTLNLMGEATVAQYQEALRSVTYDNTSADPNRDDREVSFTVNDGTLESSPLLTTVQFSDATLNLIEGDAVDNVLVGTGGQDWIKGLDGNDDLSGGASGDRLEGGAGHDTLTGGAGRDEMIGGTGADHFVFHINEETSDDLITDFSVAEGDVLDIHDLLPQGAAKDASTLDLYIHFTEEGNDTVLLLGNNMAEQGYGTTPEAPPEIQHTVVLRDANLTQNGNLSDQEVIESLLTNGNLQVE